MPWKFHPWILDEILAYVTFLPQSSRAVARARTEMGCKLPKNAQI